MRKNIGAIDALTTIALQAVKEVLEANTKIPIKASSTVQNSPFSIMLFKRKLKKLQSKTSNWRRKGNEIISRGGKNE